MINVLGEEVIGGEIVVEQEYGDTPAFISGSGPIISGVPAYLRSEILEAFSFAQFVHVQGGESNIKNNEQEDWGTQAEWNAEMNAGGTLIDNIYEPAKHYINGAAIPTLSSTGRYAYIVMRAHLMDVPTQDGNENIYANRAVDYGDHQNDILLYRSPQWILGPHD